MKKLLGISVLGLLWCNVGFAELIELNKCFKGKDSEVHETKIKCGLRSVEPSGSITYFGFNSQ